MTKTAIDPITKMVMAFEGEQHPDLSCCGPDALCIFCDLVHRLMNISDVSLSDMRFKNGQLDMTIVDGAVQRLASIMCATLMDAPNYKEMSLGGRSDVTGEDLEFVVTVQKSNRPTPHQKRMEAEREVQRLREILRENGIQF